MNWNLAKPVILGGNFWINGSSSISVDGYSKEQEAVHLISLCIPQTVFLYIPLYPSKSLI